MAKSVHAALAVAAGAMLLVATTASAQIAPNPLFPYPGQCKSGQTGSACATIPNPPLLTPLPFVGQPMFAYELAQPVGFFPASVAGQDYYEIAYAPAKGFQKLAELGIFPNPSWPGGVPNGYQWTGIVDPATRAPLLTPVWGYEQKNSGGGPLALLAGMPVSSWPSMNIAASRGTDVKVKWLNETPDQHLTCPYPQAWDWPCAIDRSVDDLARRMGFMGTQWASKSGIIPPGASKVCAKGAGELNQPQSGLACAGNADCPAGETCTAEAVTPFGGAMQADNAVVPHLHGGNIPPGSDGFAEKWFGNVVTAPKYSPGVPWPGANHPCDATCAVKAGFTGSYCIGDAAACTAVDENGDVIGWPLDPGFDVGNNITPLYRPIGNSATYHYPMSQEAATIWYHDHALGKTRINVIAGPAGFFPITDPAGSADAMLASYGLSDPTGLATCYTVNPGPPVTATFNGKSCRDRFIALQDRAFNDDGTINYPNGLGQPPIPPIQPGNINNDAGGAVTPGFNPSVIPQWVPEYFGDMSVVNGVIW
ncbi:MAG TPA: multicopper oxidase domain-containing protein, partial [Gemmatimonadales bacterium]|nr:multicopper oxidase domain-containing protein [Gemmatimonadales bacterium]